MADIYKVSGLLQYEVTVKPYATETVEFIDVRPNYYRVQNFGDTRILCGTSKVPTENNFDFACKADGMFMYSEPTSRGFLYIYNPSGNPARVKIVAFAHEFDPLTLAFSGIELDFSGTKLETSTAISGFNAALPAGSNKIGSVDVATLPADIVTAIQKMNKAQNSKCVYIQNDNLTSEGVEKTAPNGKVFTNINFLSNDGESNIWVSIDQEGMDCMSIMVKPKEVLQNVKVYAYSLFVNSGAGATSSVRAVYELREV